MDKMDRLLRRLPTALPPEGFAASIRMRVHKRHRRQLLVRRTAASVLGVLGLWMVWPVLAWLSSAEPYAPTAAWLTGGLDYLNYGSLDLLTRVWTGAASIPGTIGSALELSTWLGAVLLCCAIFLALDLGSWQAIPISPPSRGDYPVSARSLHI